MIIFLLFDILAPLWMIYCVWDWYTENKKINENQTI